MIQITADQIVDMMRYRFGDDYRLRQNQIDIIDGIVEHQAHLGAAGILDHRFRVMHFLSQAAHETDAFKTLEEYASGSAYEGRCSDLGNCQPGDGVRYKGRGIFMLTGRANYRGTGNRIGVDLERRPLRASEPEISVQTAADYWRSRNLNALADDDEPANVRAITRKINGGLNGYEDRLAYFMAAGRVDWQDVIEPPPTETVTLELSRQTAEELARALAEVL